MPEAGPNGELIVYASEPEVTLVRAIARTESAKGNHDITVTMAEAEDATLGVVLDLEAQGESVAPDESLNEDELMAALRGLANRAAENKDVLYVFPRAQTEVIYKTVEDDAAQIEKIQALLEETKSKNEFSPRAAIMTLALEEAQKASRIEELLRPFYTE
jgi:hypothetical protein